MAAYLTAALGPPTGHLAPGAVPHGPDGPPLPPAASVTLTGPPAQQRLLARTHQQHSVLASPRSLLALSPRRLMLQGAASAAPPPATWDPPPAPPAQEEDAEADPAPAKAAQSRSVSYKPALEELSPRDGGAEASLPTQVSMWPSGALSSVTAPTVAHHLSAATLHSIKSAHSAQPDVAAMRVALDNAKAVSLWAQADAWDNDTPSRTSDSTIAATAPELTPRDLASLPSRAFTAATTSLGSRKTVLPPGAVDGGDAGGSSAGSGGTTARDGLSVHSILASHATSGTAVLKAMMRSGLGQAAASVTDAMRVPSAFARAQPLESLRSQVSRIPIPAPTAAPPTAAPAQLAPAAPPPPPWATWDKGADAATAAARSGRLQPGALPAPGPPPAAAKQPAREHPLGAHWLPLHLRQAGAAPPALV